MQIIEEGMDRENVTPLKAKTGTYEFLSVFREGLKERKLSVVEQLAGQMRKHYLQRFGVEEEPDLSMTLEDYRNIGQDAKVGQRMRIQVNTKTETETHLQLDLSDVASNLVFSETSLDRKPNDYFGAFLKKDEESWIKREGEIDGRLTVEEGVVTPDSTLRPYDVLESLDYIANEVVRL